MLASLIYGSGPAGDRGASANITNKPDIVSR